MKLRKNKKRIDPRYFLDETLLEEQFEEKTTEERDKEKKAAAEARSAPYKKLRDQYEKDKAAAEEQAKGPKVDAVVRQWVKTWTEYKARNHTSGIRAIMRQLKKLSKTGSETMKQAAPIILQQIESGGASKGRQV